MDRYQYSVHWPRSLTTIVCSDNFVNTSWPDWPDLSNQLWERVTRVRSPLRDGRSLNVASNFLVLLGRHRTMNYRYLLPTPSRPTLNLDWKFRPKKGHFIKSYLIWSRDRICDVMSRKHIDLRPQIRPYWKGLIHCLQTREILRISLPLPWTEVIHSGHLLLHQNEGITPPDHLRTDSTLPLLRILSGPTEDQIKWRLCQTSWTSLRF